MTDTILPPQCPYCHAPSKLVTGRSVYPHRTDLHAKKFYRCVPCDALVGCHEGTDKPLGRLANPSLRKAKQRAHAAFDPLWIGSPGSKRRKWYSWLAIQLDIPREECHIGMFDEAMCARVVEVCNDYQRNSK